MLCIKDMAGLLKPYAAKKLVSELKQEIGIPVLNVPLITWASEANPLTGLVFCADCGVRMYNHRKKSIPELGDCFFISFYILLQTIAITGFYRFFLLYPLMFFLLFSYPCAPKNLLILESQGVSKLSHEKIN